MNRNFALVYTGWILLCGVLFLALSSAEDPSRPRGRILQNEAGARAVAMAAQRDPRYRGYEAIHVAYAGRGEGGREARWVVLLDKVPHSGHGVVVELRAFDGVPLAIRSPK